MGDKYFHTMNSFFLYWVDLAALLLSMALGITLAIKAVRKNLSPVRGAVAAFFLFFGPAAILVHMAFHLTEIFYHAGVALLEGTFAYSFRFYSLQLMGILLTCLSVTFLRNAFAKCHHRHYKNRNLFKTIGLIVLVSVPTIPFTPIGALPTLACLISLAALPFVHKRKGVKSHLLAPEDSTSVQVKRGSITAIWAFYRRLLSI